MNYRQPESHAMGILSVCGIGFSSWGVDVGVSTARGLGIQPVMVPRDSSGTRATEPPGCAVLSLGLAYPDHWAGTKSATTTPATDHANQ
eukprot:496193-Rhodomonas_salina.1